MTYFTTSGTEVRHPAYTPGVELSLRRIVLRLCAQCLFGVSSNPASLVVYNIGSSSTIVHERGWEFIELVTELMNGESADQIWWTLNTIRVGMVPITSWEGTEVCLPHLWDAISDAGKRRRW